MLQSKEVKNPYPGGLIASFENFIRSQMTAEGNSDAVYTAPVK